MSATQLTFGIVIGVLAAFTILMVTSMRCQSRERIARDRFDPRSDEQLRSEAQGKVRGES